MNPPLPANETARLAALLQYRILDTPPEAAFDDMTRLASQICQTPIALVSLIDTNRQWFKSRVGLDVTETCRDVAFCNYAIQQSDVFIVLDALADERFATNPLVREAPHIRFYMGVPLLSASGHPLGTLCVIDYQPRTTVPPEQIEALQALSRQVVKELEQRRQAIAQERTTFERQHRKRPGFFKTVIGGFGLSSAILLGIGALFFHALAQYGQMVWRVEHSREVLTDLVTLRSNLKDALIGERSYLTAGQKSYLASYDVAIAELPQQLKHLRQLTKDNPSQQRRLDRLEILIQQMLGILQENINGYQAKDSSNHSSNNFAVSSRLLLIQKSDRLLNDIHQVLHAMDVEENTLLNERSRNAEASSHVVTLVLISGLGIILAILWSIFYLINREIKARKQTEIILKQERDFTEVVLDTAAALVVVLNAQGQVLRFNRMCESTTGYSFMDVKGKKIWELDFNLLASPAQASDQLKQVMENPRPSDFPQKYESPWIAKDGMQRLIAWSNTVLLDQSGMVEYLICTGIDVTEERQVEEALQQQRKWLQVTLASIGDAVIATDREARITFMNPVAEALTGWNYAAAQGQSVNTVFRIINEKTRQPAKNPVEAALQAGMTVELENGTLLLTADQKEIPIADSCAPIRTLNNELYGAVLVFRDVSKSKAAQEQLRLLESVVVNANDAILITEAEPIDDMGPRIIYVNAAFTRMTGYALEEVLGKTPRILQGEKSDRAVLDRIRAALTDWKPVKVELINYHKNGTEFWVELNIVPISDETGWYTHWVSIQRDVTERKRVEASVLNALAREKELNELKSRFVSMVSHEFRTPLTTILSSTELLEASSHSWTETHKQRHYEQIQAAIRRMTALLNDVLLISKIEAGKLEFNPTPLNLQQFCRDLVDAVALIAERNHITITFVEQNSCELACMDARLLQQILTNLLSNALKYSRPGGNVHFTLACQHGTATFQIRDHGIGIPASDLEHLFESFHRAANVGNIEGTGLGLAIVKHSVDAHAGTIDVTSEVDRGTTFTVTLPLEPLGVGGNRG
ncbi:MAG: PAS domain S-box protein [Kovacikia sp.]